MAEVVFGVPLGTYLLMQAILAHLGTPHQHPVPVVPGVGAPYNAT